MDRNIRGCQTKKQLLNIMFSHKTEIESKVCVCRQPYISSEDENYGPATSMCLLRFIVS